MKTILPAQPGYFAVYPNDEADPIIAWEITHDPDTLDYSVWPITTDGLAGDYHEVKYAIEHALPSRG